MSYFLNSSSRPFAKNEIPLDLVFEGAEQLLAQQLLAQSFQRQFREGLEAGLRAGVLAEPHEGGAPSFLRHLLVEQAAHAVEDGRGSVGIRQQEAFADVEAAQLLADGPDENLEILADEGVFFGSQPALQLLLDLRNALTDSLCVTRAEIGDLVVDAGDADLSGAFGSELCLRLENDTGVLVASGDPVRSRLRRWQREARDYRRGRAKDSADRDLAGNL
jgi:hypothetical protein